MDTFDILSSIETLFMTSFSNILSEFDYLIYLMSAFGLIGIISAAFSYMFKGKY